MAELVAEAESLPRIAEQKAEAETKQQNLRKKYKRAIKIARRELNQMFSRQVEAASAHWF